MAAHLVAAKVAGGTATESAHETAVTLCLRVGIGRAKVLAAAVLRGVLALRVLVLGVAALLGELLRGCLARVGLLLLAVGAVGKVLVGYLM